MTKLHRPPHGDVKIQELIKLGREDEAQQCTDENIEFYRAKIAEQEDLFLRAQCHKMNVEPRSLTDTLADIARTQV